MSGPGQHLVQSWYEGNNDLKNTDKRREIHWLLVTKSNVMA
jgi:hypothetical protein